MEIDPDLERSLPSAQNKRKCQALAASFLCPLRGQL